MTETERKARTKWLGGAKAIGAYAARMLDPAARARGFATTTLLSEWPSVVGDDLAKFTAPDKVIWPRRRQEGEVPGPSTRKAEGATLVLRVDGPRAIEVQHRSDQILERVNTYFGYRAIQGLRILQAPVARTSERSAPAPLVVDPDALPDTAEIEDDGLRHALLRLGTSVRDRVTRR